ncbi:mevalonate kinase family protein [Pseudomonas akapageensis]|uniref:mevalonate kinase family protein n=1 Tax=Pseudomonas akapageensis TaxID=2609961 RepID=UPI00140D18E6|nr:hypothetical protein [Pseudomonas akapageensis]
MVATQVQAHAPAKIILMGEHAVVHHCPAVVATLGLYCHVQIQPRNAQLVELCMPDVDIHRCYSRQSVLDYTLQTRKAWQNYVRNPVASAFAALRGQQTDHLVKCAIGETLLHLGPEYAQGMKVTVRSDIPVGAGLGSSAALAVSIPAAIISHLSRQPEAAVVQYLARKIEQRQHGLPSGVDHRTILHGGIVRFSPDASGDLALSSLPNARLVLNDLRIYTTGTANESTGAVVTSVRQKLAGRNNPLLSRMRRTTEAFISLLQGQRCDRAQLYSLISEYQRSLEQLGVVPDPVQSLIRYIEEAGGAAKVSGAGALSGSSAGALLVFGPIAVTDLLQDLPMLTATIAVDGLSVDRP